MFRFIAFATAAAILSSVSPLKDSDGTVALKIGGNDNAVALKAGDINGLKIGDTQLALKAGDINGLKIGDTQLALKLGDKGIFTV